MIENQKTKITTIGVISDTHNLLRAEAVAALSDADLIVHGGDVCQPGIIEELKKIAPVIAVRGNNDKGAWANDLAVYQTIVVKKVSIYIIHDIKEMNVYPAPPDVDVIISGHSHKPLAEQRDGILYLNPGSAGARRFKLPVSVAKLKINGKNVKAELIEITV